MRALSPLQSSSGNLIIAILLAIPILAPTYSNYYLRGGEPGQPKDALGMQLILVHAGQFTMGSPASEAGRGKDERQHLVRLTAPFRMSKSLVTRGQFAQFAKAMNYATQAERAGYAAAREGGEWHRVNGASWKNPGFPQTDDDPVVNVTWVDAMMFCQWLSRSEGAVHRLPTEAEWEYCCRAGTHGAFPCGDNLEALKQAAWYDANSDGRTHPVGLKQPNPWGFLDMGGNVDEFCGDWYGPYVDNSTDPIGISAGNLDTPRVLRGGSWRGEAATCRSAARHSASSTTPTNEYGFRVCRDDDNHESFKSSGDISRPTTQMVNSIQVHLALIPAGEYMMGSPDTQPGRGDEPLHKVSISHAFYIGIVPVTREQFRVFIEASGYLTTAERFGASYEWNGKPQRINGSSWRKPGFDQSDDDPVVNVSWDDAVAFCRWLSEKEHKTYRLPTEAEWEYAGRAKTSTAYYDGDSAESFAKTGWYVRNSGGRTHRVGTRVPNAWGLYDMLGNVCQWCDDFAAPYDLENAIDPTGPQKPVRGSPRVLRGGSWIAELPACRCAARDANDPRLPANFYGFRVCLQPN